MAVKQAAGTAEEGAVAALIAASAALLKRRRDGPPKNFVEGLFSHAVPEDLLRYQPQDIVLLAEAAWSFIANRAPGETKVRCVAAETLGAARSLKPISVLEVFNDDMPFLVDSVMAELTERGLDISLVTHPVFTVARDKAGRLTAFHGAQGPAGKGLRESFIHIHIERIDDAQRAEILQAVEKVLADVRVCVADWRAMQARAGELITDLRAYPPPLPVGEIAETVQFLEWLAANNFTFLGMRDYVITGSADLLEPRYETGLGLLRAREMRELRRGTEAVIVTPEIRAFLEEPKLLIVTKSAIRSRVHRRVYMDYIGIKRFHADGRLAGEFRIVGLFTSTVYTRSTRSIPYLRRKVDAVVARAGFDPEGHSGKALVNVLETYSRDELFQIDEDRLYRFALMILQLDERPRVRVLARRDRFDRFVSILVYVPRDRYDSDVRKRIGDYLAQAFHGHVSAFYPYFPEGSLVRVHFIIGREEGARPDPDRATLEAAVGEIVRTWSDGLEEALVAAQGPAKGRGLFERYRAAFSEGYRADYTPDDAVADM